MTTKLSPRAYRSWQLSLLLYLSLVVTITLEHWLLAPPKVDSPLLIWGLRIFPLLIFAPAVVTQHGRGFAWLGFVVLFYFTSGVVNGWTYDSSTNNSWTGWLLALESMLLFITTLLFIRWYFLDNQGESQAEKSGS